MQIILGKIVYQEIGVWTVPKNNNKETEIIKIQNKISHDRLSDKEKDNAINEVRILASIDH